MATVLVVEDDYLTADSLRGTIERELADLNPQVEIVETESDFVLRWLPEFNSGPRQRPDAIVLDVMLRWTDPAPDQPAPPPEVIEGGFDRAGLRCCALIRETPKLSPCNIVLLTNLSEEDLASRGGRPKGVVFVQKGDEQRFIRHLRAAMDKSASFSLGSVD